MAVQTKSVFQRSKELIPFAHNKYYVQFKLAEVIQFGEYLPQLVAIIGFPLFVRLISKVLPFPLAKWTPLIPINLNIQDPLTNNFA